MAHVDKWLAFRQSHEGGYLLSKRRMNVRIRGRESRQCWDRSRTLWMPRSLRRQSALENPKVKKRSRRKGWGRKEGNVFSPDTTLLRCYFLPSSSFLSRFLRAGFNSPLFAFSTFRCEDSCSLIGIFPSSPPLLPPPRSLTIHENG